MSVFEREGSQDKLYSSLSLSKASAELHAAYSLAPLESIQALTLPSPPSPLRSARKLTDEQRSSVANYFAVYKGHENDRVKLAMGGFGLHPSVQQAVEVLEKEWVATILPMQQVGHWGSFVAVCVCMCVCVLCEFM